MTRSISSDMDHDPFATSYNSCKKNENRCKVVLLVRSGTMSHMCVKQHDLRSMGYYNASFSKSPRKREEHTCQLRLSFETDDARCVNVNLWITS